MYPENSVSSIKIKNDISVTVPDSAGLMTAYILLEQGGWFEDEIELLRNIIQPGMKIIDIGANYGLYTLTLSRLTGDTGKIWAFEPTEKTAAYLRTSIAENSFTNIEVIQAGLSDRNGIASFYTCDNSEWNSLSKITAPGSSTEQINLLTLDHCREIYNWSGIDFMKLDAEGEELNILKAGKDFLASESPLIMYELKHNEKVNLPLIGEFKNYGYDSYRYVPALDILVPFNPDRPVDIFQLNLFACKQDRASRLESSGVLTMQENKEVDPAIDVITEKQQTLPFWKILEGKNIFEQGTPKPYLEILALYFMATSKSKSASEKYNSMQTAIKRIQELLEQGEEKIERLATLSRIAIEAGERVMGVRILGNLINEYHDNLNFEINEPFLPAMAKYENINPGENITAWFFSSILEQYIVMHAYSTYFSQRQTLPLFSILEQLGFLDEDMLNRKNLIQSVFPL